MPIQCARAYGASLTGLANPTRRPGSGATPAPSLAPPFACPVATHTVHSTGAAADKCARSFGPRRTRLVGLPFLFAPIHSFCDICPLLVVESGSISKEIWRCRPERDKQLCHDSAERVQSPFALANHTKTNETTGFDYQYAFRTLIVW